MALESGTKLGPYEILGLLGAGGMGEVYRARDTKLSRDVALKVLPEILARDPERMARFKREAQVLASLNHPNIATIHGFEESDGVRALAMELVEGQTLAELLEAGKSKFQTRKSGAAGSVIPAQAGIQSASGVDPRLRGGDAAPGAALHSDEALPIAKQIAEGLEYAHERGIIHRDLKPANIKITPEGTVKILDFGLAKALDVDASSSNLSNSPTLSPTLSVAATQAGVILGTAAYMSPEQARGKTVDRRADIWAFGCVLYEMLSGAKPFEGETVTDVLASVVKTEPDWESLPPDTPPRLQELIRRCLAKDPKQRLQAIGDARIAIEETISGVGAGVAPAQGEAAPRPYPVWRRAMPWALGIVAGATVATLVTLAIATGVFQKPKPQVGAIRFEIRPPEGHALVGAPYTRNVVVSPNGRMIAFVAVDSNGNSSLWVRSLDAATAQQLESTQGARWPFWSPDSKFIAYFANGKVMRIPMMGGGPQTVCEVKDVSGGTWGKGGVILFGQGGGPVMRVAATGGEPAAVTELDKAKYGANVIPDFMPDGRHFLYLAVSSTTFSGSAVYSGALDSKQGKLLLTNQSWAHFYPPDHLLYVRAGTLLAQHLDTSRMELNGEPVRIAEGVSATPWGPAAFSTSSNGVLAYRSGTGSLLGRSQLAWYNRDGKKLEAVGVPGTYTQAVLSPDEKRVALQVADPKDNSNSDLWLLDLTNGVFSRLTFDPAGDVDPVWSRDSHEITYSVLKAGRAEFMQMTLGSTQPRKLYSDGQAQYLDNLSPDGKFLAYHTGDNSAFFALPMTGERKPIKLIQSAFFKDQLHFSPDGKWVAYQSNESGRMEIYVAAFPKMDQKRQVSTDGGGEAMWRMDGKELFYLSLNGKMMAVSIKVGETLETGPPKALFSANPINPFGNYDVTAYNVTRDGQKFLLLESDKDLQVQRESIHMIVNWDAALAK